MKYTIEEHWDVDGHINADSNPENEFQVWKDCASMEREWSGDEFSISDFRVYIAELKEEMENS